jgi:hypothetical protein
MCELEWRKREAMHNVFAARVAAAEGSGKRVAAVVFQTPAGPECEPGMRSSFPHTNPGIYMCSS